MLSCIFPSKIFDPAKKIKNHCFGEIVEIGGGLIKPGGSLFYTGTVRSILGIHERQHL